MNNNFLQELNYGYTIIEVQGESCANCITMIPIVHGVAQKFGNITVLTMQATKENEGILEYYDVEAIPTLLFLHNHTLLGKVKGLQPAEILELWIASKIEDFEKNNLK